MDSVTVSPGSSEISRLRLSRDGTWRRQWHPTSVLLPGKSHGWRSLVGCRLSGVAQSRTRLTRLSSSGNRDGTRFWWSVLVYNHCSLGAFFPFFFFFWYVLLPEILASKQVVLFWCVLPGSWPFLSSALCLLALDTVRLYVSFLSIIYLVSLRVKIPSTLHSHPPLQPQ